MRKERNSQAKSPAALRPRGGRLAISFPRNARGTARQAARTCPLVRTPCEVRGASRRAVAAFSLRRRVALFGRAFAFAVSQLLAEGRIAPGRSPGAARGLADEAKARGRRPPLRQQASPEDAPR